MDYKQKIEHAKKVAHDLQNQKSTEAIKEALLAEGLYDRDISNIMVSARNILGEQYQPQIREYLLQDKEVIGSAAFSTLDTDMLTKLVAQESKNLETQEKTKITKQINDGLTPEEILQQVDTRFLSVQKAAEQINRQKQVKQQNSGSGRMINIGGGIGLIVLTGIIMLTLGRLFYVLPIIGIVMIVKGFTTKGMDE